MRLDGNPVLAGFQNLGKGDLLVPRIVRAGLCNPLIASAFIETFLERIERDCHGYQVTLGRIGSICPVVSNMLMPLTWESGHDLAGSTEIVNFRWAKYRDFVND